MKFSFRYEVLHADGPHAYGDIIDAPDWETAANRAVEMNGQIEGAVCAEIPAHADGSITGPMIDYGDPPLCPPHLLNHPGIR